MKPEYRSPAHLPRPVTAAYAGTAAVRVASNPVQSLGLCLRAWWQRKRRQHADRIMVESLATLGSHLLQDLGVSDELREHALAQHESLYERLGRVEPGGFAGRFGTW